jgi:ABC-type amino acid transport substrate-binding protein
MLMALNYDKIDAIAVDLLYWSLIDNSSSGLKMIEPAFGSTGYLLYVRPEHRDFVDKYNEFLKGFKMTDTYKDLIERELAFNGNYKSPDIPLSGKGETIRVAFDITGYPRAFYDSETGEVSGFDFEVLKRFVNEYDYQLDFVMTDYNDAYAGLNSGIYDAMIGYLSDTYKEEVESVGLIVTDTYDNVPLVYVCKETTGNIDIDMNSLE